MGLLVLSESCLLLPRVKQRAFFTKLKLNRMTIKIPFRGPSVFPLYNQENIERNPNGTPLVTISKLKKRIGTRRNCISLGILFPCQLNDRLTSIPCIMSKEINFQFKKCSQANLELWIIAALTLGRSSGEVSLAKLG